MASGTSTPKHLYPPPGGSNGAISPTLGGTRDLPATGSSASHNNLQSSGNSLTSSESRRFRIQGWDPILIVAQIVAVQTLHYLTLALLVPPLLSIFADPVALDFEGGAANIAMIMDWREMAGRGTLQADAPVGGGTIPPGLLDQLTPSNAAPLDQKIRRVERALRRELAGGEAISASVSRDVVRSSLVTDMAADPRKGWVLGASWGMASMLGCVSLSWSVKRFC